MFQVQKKDGKMEPFERNKIIAGIIAAGGTMEDAERVASQVEEILPTIAVNGTIKSTDIRSKGLEFFRSSNPKAAEYYEEYQKPR